MRRQAFILFFLSIVHMVYPQQNGTGDLSHPTVDELHLKLNELVSRFKADEDQKRKNAQKAKVKGDTAPEGPADEFRIILERGGKRTALDKDNPVVLEEIVMKMSGNNIISIELKYEEAALRRQFIHKRSIKNDDIKKTTYGHLALFYHAEGDTSKSEVLVNMSSSDRGKLFAIYIDGLLRAIRDLDDRVLAAKKCSGKKMNAALNMGVRIK
ncbi:MAG: hypothetical protein JNJ69_04800 [Leptospiraceae bacterium]|nr:hypothetical protein [Leptospiraceae bacterium]